jgi:hypothetical protein
MMDTGLIVTISMQTIAYGIGLFKMWSDMQLKLKELEMRVQNVEKMDTDIKSAISRMEKMITEIRLELKDKADRNG